MTGIIAGWVGTSVCRRHRWQVVAEKLREASGMEKFKAAGGTSLQNAQEGFFEATYLVTYRCFDCGTEKVEAVTA